ncbi:hypothetical protein [Streptomyces sp. NPDC055085]
MPRFPGGHPTSLAGAAALIGRARAAAFTAPAERVVALVGLDTIIECHPTLAQALKS